MRHIIALRIYYLFWDGSYVQKSLATLLPTYVCQCNGLFRSTLETLSCTRKYTDAAETVVLGLPGDIWWIIYCCMTLTA